MLYGSLCTAVGSAYGDRGAEGFSTAQWHITISLTASDNIHVLSHSPGGQKSRWAQWDLYLGSHEIEIKVVVPVLMWRFQGRVCFWAYSGWWPNSAPSFLAGCQPGPPSEAIHAPCLVTTSVFKASHSASNTSHGRNLSDALFCCLRDKTLL